MCSANSLRWLYYIAPVLLGICIYIIYVYICHISTPEIARLPLNKSCNLLEQGCFKGDLIDVKIADCKRDGPNVNLQTCDPINDLLFSSVVDLPDVKKHGVSCNADTECPIICGAPESDTRCVCDKPVDWNRPKETILHRCRCQYWPTVDTRESQPSFCTQFDHGGKTKVHFYICCNNCQDKDTSCNGYTYQGGGSRDAYCDVCGKNTQLGGGRATYAFNCVSCSQQNACEEKCDREWMGIPNQLPGLCPKWAACFRGCCVNATT